MLVAVVDTFFLNLILSYISSSNQSKLRLVSDLYNHGINSTLMRFLSANENQRNESVNSGSDHGRRRPSALIQDISVTCLSINVNSPPLIVLKVEKKQRPTVLNYKRIKQKSVRSQSFLWLYTRSTLFSQTLQILRKWPTLWWSLYFQHSSTNFKDLGAGNQRPWCTLYKNNTMEKVYDDY